MNELALENPSGLLRAKARVVGAMLLYKETDMHDEVDKYYLINTKRSKLPDGRKSKRGLSEY